MNANLDFIKSLTNYVKPKIISSKVERDIFDQVDIFEVNL